MEKIALFDGTSLEGWRSIGGSPAGWRLEDGFMTVSPGAGNIVSKETFGDAMIHLEWREPDMPEAEGQYKGNSGVYIHGVYELQVLDSYGVKDPRNDDCGAIYQMYAPSMNACKPPMTWQTYDILFRAARFDESGKKTEDARLTVRQNGLPILNSVILWHPTPGGLSGDESPEGPLMLQDHGDKVSFRNIWILKL